MWGLNPGTLWDIGVLSSAVTAAANTHPESCFSPGKMQYRFLVNLPVYVNSFEEKNLDEHDSTSDAVISEFVFLIAWTQCSYSGFWFLNFIMAILCTGIYNSRGI